MVNRQRVKNLSRIGRFAACLVAISAKLQVASMNEIVINDFISRRRFSIIFPHFSTDFGRMFKIALNKLQQSVKGIGRNK